MTDTVLSAFLQRVVPHTADAFQITLDTRTPDGYTVTFVDGAVHIVAGSRVSACNAVYDYLKQICRVNLSWCGNEALTLTEVVPFEGTLEKTIAQKYRVYMNYCTLDYSMCWWDWARWEQEIDFMAMNGINMPLCVIGTEAVWFETLLQFGFTQKEALDTISGPAFWAWQLMTNIEGYLPPQTVEYVYERLALGKKILARMLEFGMLPIQQGFSGHVPMLLREKYPNARITAKHGWCFFPKTAQLDPLDPLFSKFGTVYLEKLDALLGNHHYLACDPFHEGTPPKKGFLYLRRVGRAIDTLYRNFDADSVWVMQAWSLRKHIVKAVPKERLLVLDINSERTPKNRNMWGYPVVAGMLHNFGGKNAMQGKLRLHCKNPYAELKTRGANVVGSGLFMEGIEQNPVVYDLQFELLTKSDSVDFDKWLTDYIERRYGKYDQTLRAAWDILLKTCYSNDGYQENEVGSVVCARPLPFPKRCGPCDITDLFYDPKELEKALALFLSVQEEFKDSDGYQYDLCDLTRQVLSNRFHVQQKEFASAFKAVDATQMRRIADAQTELLYDLDTFLSNRKNFTLARWVNQSHALGTTEAEKRYFDQNARTLITLWGDMYGDNGMLYDYAWREWSGLIKEFYAVRWARFYDAAIDAAKQGKSLETEKGTKICDRPRPDATVFGKALFEFEKHWCETYSEYQEPVNRDVTDAAQALFCKYVGKDI